MGNGNTNNDGVCEKLYKAIWHVSPNLENPKLSKNTLKSQAISTEVPVVFNTPDLPHPAKEKEHATKTTGQVLKVPSKIDSVIKTRVINCYDTVPASVAVLEKTKSKVEVVPQVKAFEDGLTKLKKEGKPTGNYNAGSDDFSNYIKRAKAKMRTTSSIGGGKDHESLAKLDSFDVKVGDYLMRTKKKIRTVSGIGSGRTAK